MWMGVGDFEMTKERLTVKLKAMKVMVLQEMDMILLVILPTPSPTMIHA